MATKSWCGGRTIIIIIIIPLIVVNGNRYTRDPLNGSNRRQLDDYTPSETHGAGRYTHGEAGGDKIDTAAAVVDNNKSYTPTETLGAGR